MFNWRTFWIKKKHQNKFMFVGLVWFMVFLTFNNISVISQERIQDFKLGGGGGALKKIAPSGGRRENFWGISCEKSRFYAKKSYFFQLRREARTFWGYFV